MRRLLILGAAALALAIAGVAGAAPLNYSGTSTTTLGDNPPGVLHGGGVATVNSSSGVIPAHLNTLRQAASRGQIGGTFTSIITDPETIGNGIAALIYSNVGGGTGTYGPISGGAASTTALTQNLLPVHGIVKVCLLTTSCTAFIPTILSGTTANGAVAAVGVGGLITAGGVGIAIRISLEAAPWTIKTATAIDQIETGPQVGANTTLITVTRKGFAHDPSSGTTSTAQPSGVVQLVTPSQVTTNLPFGTSALIASHVVVLIHFIPEPGMLLLLGSGVVGLALLGRRRMRK